MNNRSYYAFYLMGVFCLSSLSLAGPAPEIRTVYAAPDGDDSASGTIEKPLKTIAAALQRTRAFKAGAQKAIILSGGQYYNVHANLQAGDSGLTIRAAHGTTPILYGGRMVKGWQKDGDFYSAELAGVQEGQWDFRALIVDHQLRPRARYPRQGAFKHLSEFNVRWLSTIGNGWERAPTAEELTTMKYKKGDLGVWLDVKNAELTIYHAWDESIVGLRALDDCTHTVRFSNPSGHPPGSFGAGFEKAKTYVVWNIREGMTEPGQWYLDRSHGKLVYWPLPGEDMNRVEVIAPVAETIFTLAQGTNNVTIEGLTLSCTTTPLITGGFGAGAFQGAIQGQNVNHCNFHRLVVEHVGGWAIGITGDDNKITHCEIHHTGAGAIQHAGANLEIFNTHIHHIGLIYPSAIGILGGGKGVIIRHNEIHHTPYSGIHCSSAGALIESNLFYDTMQVLNDGAAIYIGFARGMVVRGNIVRGHRGSGPAHAYYMDEMSDSCVVESNLAVDTAWPSHNHMTVHCIIRNNLFVDHGSQKLTFPRSLGMIFEKNILVAEEITFQYPSGKEELPASASPVPEAVKPFLKADGIVAMPDNIIFSRSGKVHYNVLADYKTVRAVPLQARDGTLFTDPMLNDPEQGDYSFQPGSPAVKAGINPIDVIRAGREKAW